MKLPLAFEINFISSTSIPPQSHGGKRQHDFGSEELEASSRKALSKNISELIISSNVFDKKITTKNTLSNEMVFYFNMLRLGVENGIKGNSQG